MLHLGRVASKFLEGSPRVGELTHLGVPVDSWTAAVMTSFPMVAFFIMWCQRRWENQRYHGDNDRVLSGGDR